MKAQLQIALWVGLGSGFGGLARVLLVWVSGRLPLGGFPGGILAANLAGSFVLGGLAAWLTGNEARPLSSGARQFLMAGFCGGFTTYSLFSLGLVEMVRDGRAESALVYAGATLAGCMIAVWAGYRAGTLLSRRRCG